jgi:hypothetical protein
MQSISIKEASEVTGKNEKTIRRFCSKPESKPFIEQKGTKLYIDVNYLFASYPPQKDMSKEVVQKVDKDERTQEMSIDTEFFDLKNKIALYEQEIRLKDQILQEREHRILDLQKAMLLLSPPEKKELLEKKKSWWRF